MLLHSAIDLYFERKQRKQRPLYFPSPPPSPEMVRIIGGGGTEEAMRPVCADCERSRFLAGIFYQILVITFYALVYPPLFTAK